MSMYVPVCMCMQVTRMCTSMHVSVCVCMCESMTVSVCMRA